MVDGSSGTVHQTILGFLPAKVRQGFHAGTQVLGKGNGQGLAGAWESWHSTNPREPERPKAFLPRQARTHKGAAFLPSAKLHTPADLQNTSYKRSAIDQTSWRASECSSALTFTSSSFLWPMESSLTPMYNMRNLSARIIPLVVLLLGRDTSCFSSLDGLPRNDAWLACSGIYRNDDVYFPRVARNRSCGKNGRRPGRLGDAHRCR